MNDNIYIARDGDGDLAIYEDKPTYNKVFGSYDGKIIQYINSDLYPEVTFENSPVILKPVINNG